MRTMVFTFWIEEDQSPDGARKYVTIIGKPYVSDDKTSPQGYIWFTINTVRVALSTCVIDLKLSSMDWNKFFSVTLDEEIMELKPLIKADIFLDMPVEYDD